MPPSDARYPRRGRRARGGRTLAPPEALERRELLAYSPLGYSLPDLTVVGYSAPVASWGEPIAITADVFNVGASSITEPFNQIPPGETSPGLPGQGLPGTSHADSAATVLDVFASTRPGKGPFVDLGELAVPSIPQNNFSVVSGDITLPAKPAGFPQNGKIYLTFVVDGNNAILEQSYRNNAFKSHVAVTMAPALPNLQVIGFFTPTPLVPGQAVVPVIQIANLGTAPTSEQGPVTVDIVASLDTNFGPTDTILATYTVANIPPLSAVSTTAPFGGGSLNVQTPTNVITLDSQVVTLPTTPNIYFLGVKVDPTGAIKQQGHLPTARLDAFVKVGPPIPGFAPPAVLPTTGTGTGVVTTHVFPYPLPGASSSGGLTTTTTITTSPNQPVLSAVALTTPPRPTGGSSKKKLP